MMLYLVRHAQAKSKDEDPERPLSEQGTAEAESVARTLRERGDVAPVRIYHSGKTRARETAETLARTLGIREIVADGDALSPDADPAEWDRPLRNLDDDLMLVGHLPHMARMAGYLLEDDPEGKPVAFDTATVAALERDGSGAWRHRWSETGMPA